MLREAARNLFFKVRGELKVPLRPRDELDFSSAGKVTVVMEEMVTKLFSAWKENLMRGGHRIAEYVLTCYASRDAEFPLYPMERGIRDVDGSGERARARVAHAAHVVSSFVDAPSSSSASTPVANLPEDLVPDEDKAKVDAEE